jgi:hypothetical protein
MMNVNLKKQQNLKKLGEQVGAAAERRKRTKKAMNGMVYRIIKTALEPLFSAAIAACFATFVLATLGAVLWILKLLSKFLDLYVVTARMKKADISCDLFKASIIPESAPLVGDAVPFNSVALWALLQKCKALIKEITSEINSLNKMILTLMNQLRTEADIVGKRLRDQFAMESAVAAAIISSG